MFFISYAVIAYGCAECPKLSCGREGCDTEFCYHCRQLWHPDQTCDQARRQRARHTLGANDISTLYVFNEEPGGMAQILVLSDSVLYSISEHLHWQFIWSLVKMQKRSSPVPAVVPISWKQMMAAAIGWIVQCVPVSSVGYVCRRSRTCTTSGTRTHAHPPTHSYQVTVRVVSHHQTPDLLTNAIKSSPHCTWFWPRTAHLDWKRLSHHNYKPILKFNKEHTRNWIYSFNFVFLIVLESMCLKHIWLD